MDGTLLITDGFGACVWKLATDGQPEKLVVGEPLKNPVGIVRAGNQLLITDPRALSVFRCTLDGKLTKIELSTGE